MVLPYLIQTVQTIVKWCYVAALTCSLVSSQNAGEGFQYINLFAVDHHTINTGRHLLVFYLWRFVLFVSLTYTWQSVSHTYALLGGAGEFY